MGHLLQDLSICLPFTGDCPSAYAEVVARRRLTGRSIAAMDALIAAIAIVQGAAIATRDTGGFDGLGLPVVDPLARLTALTGPTTTED